MTPPKKEKSTKKPGQNKILTSSISVRSSQLSKISTQDTLPGAMNQGDLSYKLRIELMKRKIKGGK